MNRPVLSLQTVYFHGSDREDAQRLGGDLYERLTRTTSDALAYGPSIPVVVGVKADRVDVAHADTTVLIPILGKTCFLTMADKALKTIAEWHVKLGPGQVLAVPTSQNWRSREAELPGKQMLTMLYAKSDPRSVTLDEIVLATARLWEPERKNVRLFISHAKADLTATDAAAKQIFDFVVTDTTGTSFFDANDLRPGESLDEQLVQAVERGVVIAVRGDAYSSRVWCQKELLVAKLNGMPTLTVEILRRGELRSSPYGGNSPCMVWDKNPARIVSQAMVEWLRSEFFKREARRIIAAASLPDDAMIVARPPELLDLAQGPLQSDRAQFVLHPDPELSVIERRVLKAARPRLRLATPSTAFRRLLSRSDETADVSSPLEGMQVAMSLSESPDVGGPEGFTKYHVEDATVQTARALISVGAAIAYGGDFRSAMDGGITPLLAQLIQTYNQTATTQAQALHSYLAAIVKLEDAPENTPLIAHHMKDSEEMAEEARLPDPAASGAPPAPFYFSDMRRAMEKCVAARVILGGNANARVEKGGPGYGGRYPGVVEEAWRSLELIADGKQGKPLYVVGGFGGAAALVADLLEGKDVPEKLRDSTWMAHPFYAEHARMLDAHPAREKLDLPRSIEDLAQAIVTLGQPHLRDDATALAWNGLTRDENLQLFRTRDPVTIAALISKGILRIARKQREGMLQIELVNDSLVAADKLDAIAIAAFEGVQLGGAGAAIDQLTGGMASNAQRRGHTVSSLKESLIDADWLVLASLGALGDSRPIIERVEQAARETAAEAARFGFKRVGVVSFGGNVLPEIEPIAQAMVRGFREASPIVVWYETDEGRFKALCEALGKMEDVKLTTRRPLTRIAATAAGPEPFYLTVQLAGDDLSATSLAPSAAAAVPRRQTTLSQRELSKLSEGSGPGKRGTPDLAVLETRGHELAERLLGKQAAAILSRCKDSQLVVVHDAPAARVPFEMLLAKPDLRPALSGGITRRLSVTGLAFERQFTKPPKSGKLKVLLIANPTRDLPGAAREAKRVKEVLVSQKHSLELEELWEDQATPESVIAALKRSDILHYCGHAFFDGPGAKESGLVLAGQTEFTGDDLRTIDPLPRMAFVNACEAGRVRGRTETRAAAFAELFLHSGMDAYLGTYWEVGDTAAALFAGTVYTRLAMGETLEQATLAGRKALFEAKESDWANYMLFGGGNFRLVVQG